MKKTLIKRNDQDMDRDATVFSIRIVSKLVDQLRGAVLSQISERASLRIEDPVINSLLNQILHEKIKDLPLQIVDMAIEQYGDAIQFEILELIGEPISAETKDYVLKLILLAKHKAREKWVSLPISKEYAKF